MNSYQLHTADGSTSQFSWSDIDGYLALDHIIVTVDGVEQEVTTDYSINEAGRTITFVTPPSASSAVKIYRDTPIDLSNFFINFARPATLTAADLNTMAKQLLFIGQEARENGSGSLTYDSGTGKWDADGSTVGSLPDPTDDADAATKGYVDDLAVYGGAVVTPQRWSFTGTGAQTVFNLTSPSPLQTNAEMFVVSVNGVLKIPTVDYSVGSSTITFVSAPALSAAISVRNIGVGRIVGATNIATADIQNGAITEPKLATGAVTTNKIGAGSVTTAKIDPGAVTRALIADEAVGPDQVESETFLLEHLNQSQFAVATPPANDAFLVVSAAGVLSMTRIDTMFAGKRINDLAVPNASWSNGNQKITSVATPTSSGDAATKGYVDSLANSVPVGSVLDYAGSSAPTGFLLCYGQAVSRTTYAALFAIVGTTYGAGDGSTTFNLPDCRGRVGIGKDNMGGSAASRITAAVSGITGTTLGSSGGSQSHTLLVTELPGSNGGAGVDSMVSVSGVGGTNPFAIVQPGIIFNKIIKT